MTTISSSKWGKIPREYLDTIKERGDMRQFFFDKIYREKVPAQQSWTAGTATSELITLVQEGIISPGARVLEVGCGIGTEAIFLALHGMHVTAIDISPIAIETAQSMAKLLGVEVDFRLCDALDLSMVGNEFDVIRDQFCFHHLSDSERPIFAREIARVLKPNGLFVLHAFSEKILGGSYPRRMTSKELLSVFTPHLQLEHLERVLSFSTERRKKPLCWYSLWVKGN